MFTSLSLLPDSEDRRFQRHPPRPWLLWVSVSLFAVTVLSLDLAAHMKHASHLAELEAKLVYLHGEVDFLRTRLDGGDDDYYFDGEGDDYDENGEDEVRAMSAVQFTFYVRARCLVHLLYHISIFLKELLRRRKRQLTTDDGFTRGEGEENVPIVAASYHGNERQNTEGLRVYDAWFQHKSENEIPKPRRQHHHRNGKSGRTGRSLVIFRRENCSIFKLPPQDRRAFH